MTKHYFNFNMMIKMFSFTLLMAVSINCLKHSKNNQRNKPESVTHGQSQPTTKIGAESSTTSVSPSVSTSVTGPTPSTSYAIAPATASQPATIQPIISSPVAVSAPTQVPTSTETSTPPVSLAPIGPQPILNLSLPHTFMIVPSHNQYVIPITVGDSQYQLGILYGENDKESMASWIFTTLTNKQNQKDDKNKGHQLCDANDDCQQITKYVECTEKGKSSASQCKQDGKYKQNTQIMTSKNKVLLSFAHNNQTFQQVSFVSPSKVTLSSGKIQADQIQGFMNVALDNELQYSNQNCLILNHANLTILKCSQFQKLIDDQQLIQLGKKGILSLSSDKDLFIRTQRSKQKKGQAQETNIKQEYKKVIIKFDRSQLLMGLPKTMVTTIKNLLKSEYFGDRCKVDGKQIACSADPIKNITKIKLCRDKKGTECLQFNILGRIIKQQKPNRVYKLLIQEYKGEDANNTIVLYPKAAQTYQIYAEKGIIKGVKYLTDIQQQQPQQKQSSKTQKQAKKQNKKQAQQEQQNQQKDSTHQDQQNSNELQSQQEQQQQEESQSEKKTNKKLKSKQKQTHMQTEQKGHIQQEKKYGKGILFFIFVYGGIFILILAIIKIKAKQSMAASLIDRFLEVTWYRIIQNYFQGSGIRNSGYNAPKFQDEDGDRYGHEQVDRSDSVAVGISEKDGKQLFWEKNSVEGI